MVQGLKERFCRSILACRVVPALPATHKVGRLQRAASLRPLDPIVARTLIQIPLILRRRLVRDLSTLEMGANPCCNIMHAIRIYLQEEAMLLAQFQGVCKNKTQFQVCR